MVRKSILDETQEDRDRELAEYLGRPIAEVRALDISDRRGPPIYIGPDVDLASYDHLYAKFHHADEATALRAFALFIIQKRGNLVRRAVHKLKRTKGVRALDFGCGVGSHGIYLLERGVGHVDFVDVDGPALKYAHWRLLRRGFNPKRWNVYGTDRLLRGPYDLVLCVDVLEHVADPLEQLTRIVRVHRQQGWLVLQVGKMINPEQGHFARSNRIIESTAYHKKLKRNYHSPERFFYRRK